MPVINEERLRAELVRQTERLAGIVVADPARPVPTCPGWTFRELATHVGRGHRWAAQIVGTRATEPLSPRDVADGRLPDGAPAQSAWLRAGAEQVVEAVSAAGNDPVWTFTGMRPARFWTRRRAHETAVHLADALLAAGQPASLPADLAADGISEWLELLSADEPGATDAIRARSRQLRGDGQALHFHATDEGLDGTGEWVARRTPAGLVTEHGHAKADMALRGPAVSLLLVLTRRLPPSDPAVEVLGDLGVLERWLADTPF